MLSNPGASLPHLGRTRYDVKATYNLFSHPKSTPEKLQAAHRELVCEALHAPGDESRLLVEDTTTMSWPAERPILGLAPIGEKNAFSQGFLAHTVLALTWAPPDPMLEHQLSEPGGAGSRHPPLEFLGIADQQFVLRKPVPEEEARLPAGSRPFRRASRTDRESMLWLESTRHLGSAPEGVRWVRICDRGADIYEFLESAIRAHHGFVVRAAQNRALLEDAERHGEHDGEHLFERVRSEAPIASLTIELRSRPGKPARTATISISAAPVVLRSPRRPGASPGKMAPIHCTAIRAWEENPLEGEDPLEWILLTDVGAPVGALGAGGNEDNDSAIDPSAAVECVLQYATRWVIEEFHKVLKTGLGAERLQLEHADRLFAAIALMSVVAIRLLDLRESVRAAPGAPAESSGVDPLSITLLERHVGRRLDTVGDVALAIGRLGGHMGRKRDGLPGWKTLWLGLTRLDAMTLGARLALQQQSRFG
jgi:hypothetical protein